MFCPKCATQNLEGASFCRSCGANISLVPQALTGQLAQPPETVDDAAVCGTGRRRRRELTLDHSFRNIFMGVAFLLVAIGLSRTIGSGWWFWLLLPAFSMMGTGIAQYIRVREKAKYAPLAAPPASRVFPDQTPAPDVLRAPVGSVTEATTRHLNANERR